MLYTTRCGVNWGRNVRRCKLRWYGLAELMGSGRVLVFRVRGSEVWGRGFDPHTGHGSLLKLRQFNLLQLASFYSSPIE